MDPQEKPGEFTLLQDGIVERLIDADFFVKCVGYNYKILAEGWGCRVDLSRRRLQEARGFWQEDVGRTLRESMPPQTKALDHFKNASFIAFWLRRMLPINSTQKLPFHPEGKQKDAEVRLFFQYGNEIVALLIGFQICLFYEAAKVIQERDKVVPLHPNRLEYLSKLQFPSSLLNDFAMVLKHKNISPHSLYLMYKSLFTEIGQASAS